MPCHFPFASPFRKLLQQLATIVCLGLAALGGTAYATSTIALNSATTSWAPVLKGSGFDYVSDQQATARDLELVGNAAHPLLYTYYEDNGTADDTDDFIYFRVRLSG